MKYRNIVAEDTHDGGAAHALFRQFDGFIQNNRHPWCLIGAHRTPARIQAHTWPRETIHEI